MSEINLDITCTNSVGETLHVGDCVAFIDYAENYADIGFLFKIDQSTLYIVDSINKVRQMSINENKSNVALLTGVAKQFLLEDINTRIFALHSQIRRLTDEEKNEIRKNSFKKNKRKSHWL